MHIAGALRALSTGARCDLIVAALRGSEDMMEGVLALAQKRRPEWRGK